jgi:hypothetical protein
VVVGKKGMVVRRKGMAAGRKGMVVRRKRIVLFGDMDCWYIVIGPGRGSLHQRPRKTRRPARPSLGHTSLVPGMASR